MVGDICIDMFVGDREVGGRHDDGNEVFHGIPGEGTAEHGDFCLLEIDGPEKRKPMM